MSSARKYDVNGFFEVPRNPITRVGVFPYLGAQIGAPPEEAGKVFRVLRPPEELSDPEFLTSLRLTPFVDDHEMLGDEAEGLTETDQKGVHGVLGEDVEYDNGVVYSNLKVFSPALARKMRDGKKEVSLGYRCRYEFTPGTFQGEPYDAIQRQPRANHLALVKEGRMGPEFRVLDSLVITVDAKDAIDMADPVAPAAPAAPQQAAPAPDVMQKIVAAAQAIIAAVGGQAEPAGEPDGDEPVPPAGETGDEMTPPPAEETPAGDAVEEDPPMSGAAADAALILDLQAQVAALQNKDTPAMDARAIAQDFANRDRLAGQVKPFIGAFDHAGMTHAEVAKYAADKLDLGAPEGSEAVAVAAYLKDRPDPSQAYATHAADADVGDGSPTFVDRYKNQAGA